MPDPISAIGAAVSIGGSLIKGSAAKKASQAQIEQSEAAIAEQQAAREELRRLLSPYTSAGTSSLQMMLGALGLNGADAENQFVTNQENSPIFQALARQGEDAILQNASATGGLRGGNVQGALAQFRPALLNQFLEQRYGRLADLTALGQRSAAGVGAGSMNTATNIGNIMGDIGAAQAGAATAKGQMWGDILGTGGGILKGMF